MKRIFHVIVVVILAVDITMLASCANKADCTKGEIVELKYATLLSIEQRDGYRLVIVKDPWNAHSVLHKYALIDHDAAKPADIDDRTTVLRVPLRRMCVATSVHAGLMDKLDALGSVKSVCEGKYIFNTAIKEALKAGDIKDVGSGLNPSVEMIAQLETDALLMSPFEGASYGLLEKTGIPIIECADYMERSALGRAEWMRFYGILAGKEREADSLFREIVKNYEELTALAATATTRPKLLTDMLNGNIWYVPGGGSIYGTLYRDAGADFSIADDGVSGSQPLSAEKVLTTAKDADVWIIKYSRPEDYTLAELKGENALYNQLAPLHSGRVFGCNALKVPFYEEAPFRPDLLLRDIVCILHPELLPGYRTVFYSALKPALRAI